MFALAILFFVIPNDTTPAQQTLTAEQRKALAEQVQPGPEHRALARLEGQWTFEVTYDLGTPQPIKGHGTATNRMILGNRFLVSERKSTTAAGSMGDIVVEAMNIYGFDRRTNEYTLIELDTTGTYWVSAAGSAGSDKAIVMSGESLDDHSGVREMRQFDMVLQVIDSDTYITKVIFKFPNRPPTTLVETVHLRRR